eukprot:1290722-Prymnesium_polylepis.1
MRACISSASSASRRVLSSRHSACAGARAMRRGANERRGKKTRPTRLATRALSATSLTRWTASADACFSASAASCASDTLPSSSCTRARSASRVCCSSSDLTFSAAISSLAVRSCTSSASRVVSYAFWRRSATLCCRCASERGAMIEATASGPRSVKSASGVAAAACVASGGGPCAGSSAGASPQKRYIGQRWSAKPGGRRRAQKAIRVAWTVVGGCGCVGCVALPALPPPGRRRWPAAPP